MLAKNRKRDDKPFQSHGLPLQSPESPGVLAWSDRMHEPKPDDTRANPYDQAFADLTRSGLSEKVAAEAVAEKYLDGKPRTRGKHKISRVERDAAFWTSGFLLRLTPDVWQIEALVLALTRYLGQTRVSNLELLEQVAALAPDTVRQAARWSGLVLQPHSPRRGEFVRLAVNAPGDFADLVQVLDVFARAHQERVAAVEQARAPLAGLSPLELLVYASLFAFERLVPADLAGADLSESGRSHVQAVWDAINDLLIWKLSTAPKRSLNLTEADIGRSLATHLSPFLFPALNGQAPRHDLRDAFEKLVAWQMELNGFLSRSADAFSYDDSIRFVLSGERLEIVELDPAARGAWSRDGRKLDRLHRYWLNRAVDAFAASGKCQGSCRISHAVPAWG